MFRASPLREDDGGPTGFFFRHLADPLARPFFLFVLGAARMGPTVEVYRL